MKLISRFADATHVVSKLLLPAFVLIGATLLPGFAHAQCSLGSGGTSNFMISIPSPVTIPRDAPVGSVIGQGTATVAFSNASPTGVYCTAAASYVYSNLQGGSSSGSNSVMPIGSTGIGYTLQAGSSYYSTATGTLPATWFQPSSCGQTAGGKCYAYLGPTVTLRLIKLSPLISSQTIAAGQYFTATVGGLTAGTVSLANPVQITNQTCTVTTPSISVPLGNVPLSQFGPVGSTSNTVPFQIGLNCSGVATSYYITFTDSNNPGNNSNALSLTSDSSAKGVGIQILKGGNPVAYGPDSSVAGNLNQIFLGTTAGTDTVVSLPFGGRYVKIDSTMTPGSANGVATFTMSYQ
ncbi:type 1 fimbrial protein [Paraburkholderia sp. MMS20-SJTR3]|uniref:Type 1 fimbrial protein n=1 Tax=Paraburkholderia sejongensis TaxID=2886946 RepID=A0ABS8JX51_9BURK|nr:fimbrial protein [Paraburkholderia sp. MMS20-SJTR3]MCC8394459.1 type 1 fimbrial protein [Paraburkholderia sp. MMS20-SJTR3]